MVDMHEAGPSHSSVARPHLNRNRLSDSGNRDRDVSVRNGPVTKTRKRASRRV